MKPCYRLEDNLYLLAHISRDGDQVPQPCKALISPGVGSVSANLPTITRPHKLSQKAKQSPPSTDEAPTVVLQRLESFMCIVVSTGNCPTFTKVSGAFLRRRGWLACEAAPPLQDSETAITDGANSHEGTKQLFHCKLVVGSCQLVTTLQVEENIEFSDQCMLARWHIYIGRKDFEALQRNAWDIEICYLSAKPEQGRLGSPPNCPLRCRHFLAALKNGHSACLKYWDMDRVWHYRCGQKRESRPYRCLDGAQEPSAEALMFVHDVLGVPWDRYTCGDAAGAGSVDCLSYAHASGCPWDSHTCAMAASFGHVKCLAYAHEHGCDWDEHSVHAATLHGRLDCLKYAHTHGCPYNAGRHINFWEIRVTYDAICRGLPWPCLMYAHDAMGCAWDPKGNECKLAFVTGNLEMLQYIHLHGGVLCTQFEQLLWPDTLYLCPDSDTWLDAVEVDAERKANCLLYMLLYGGCQVKGIWHTKVGKLVQEIIKGRRVAVLLSFHAVGKARARGRLMVQPMLPCTGCQVI